MSEVDSIVGLDAESEGVEGVELLEVIDILHKVDQECGVEVEHIGSCWVRAVEALSELVLERSGEGVGGGG